MSYLQLIMHDVPLDALLAKLAELGVHPTVVETPPTVTTPPAAPVERVEVRALPDTPFGVRTLKPTAVFSEARLSAPVLRSLPLGDESLKVREVWCKVYDSPPMWVRYAADALDVG